MRRHTRPGRNDTIVRKPVDVVHVELEFPKGYADFIDLTNKYPRIIG